MAGKIRPPAIAAILSLVSACRVSPTKSATATTLRSEIRRPYQSAGPNSHTNGTWASMNSEDSWRQRRGDEVGPVDVLELREPYGLVEQRTLTVVDRVGEGERVPSVPQRQRGKTLGKEQDRGGGNERPRRVRPCGLLSQTFTRRQALPCTRTQALYPTAFGAGHARTMPGALCRVFRRTRAGLCSLPHRVLGGKYRPNIQEGFLVETLGEQARDLTEGIAREASERFKIDSRNSLGAERGGTTGTRIDQQTAALSDAAEIVNRSFPTLEPSGGS